MNRVAHRTAKPILEVTQALKPWMTAQEVAAFLGCHTDTVYEMRSAGKLPARPHGTRSWRFARTDVEQLGRAEAPTTVVSPAMDRAIRTHLATALRQVAEELGGIP